MANHVLLDNVSHQNIKVINQRSADYGDNQTYARVFPGEYQQVQMTYPIFFRKSSQNQNFETVALLGLQDQQNLFLNDQGWDDCYIPLSILRGPFLIGFQQQVQNGTQTDVPVVHIDLDNPRVNEAQGEALYLKNGGQSPFLEDISAILKAIYDGHLAMQEFCKRLTDLELLEAVTLRVPVKNNDVIALEGFYTINETVLKNLSAEQLQSLNQNDYLEYLFGIKSSTLNVQSLIKKYQLLV